MENKKKRKAKIEEIEFVLGIGHFCLVITLILLVWNNLAPLFEGLNIFLQALFLLITGIGACMIYMFMGFMLQDLQKEIFKKEFKNDKRKKRT